MRIKGFSPTLFRYVFGEITRPFLGGILFFIFVLMMFQIIRLADFFVIHSVSGKIILLLMSYLSLSFIPIVLPISFLLAVLLGFGRLSADAEITAMRASGLSLKFLMMPTLTLSILITIAMLVSSFYFVPWANRMFRYELFRISNTKAIATIHDGTFTEGFFDLVVYAEKTDSRENTMENILIYDERKPTDPITVVAKHGQLMGNYQDDDGTPGLLLRLFNGNLHKVLPQSTELELIEFESYDIFLRIETGKFGGIDKPKTLDITDLNLRIDEITKEYNRAKSDEERRRKVVDLMAMKVEWQKRFALSVSPMIFALMGVAFGVVRTRTVRSNSFLICLLVLLVYWVVYTAGDKMASEGRISPWMGIWVANLILFIISFYSLRRAAR